MAWVIGTMLAAMDRINADLEEQRGKVRFAGTLAEFRQSRGAAVDCDAELLRDEGGAASLPRTAQGGTGLLQPAKGAGW